MTYDEWAKKNRSRATKEGYEKYRTRYYQRVLGKDLVTPGASNNQGQVSPPEC